MTTFEDGPAKGQNLMLRRAPVFLRVVERAGVWDALDQLEDTPAPDETIHAYALTAKPGGCHINRGGGRGGFYVVAIYKQVNNPPPSDVMRETDRWAQWCHERGPGYLAETAGL